MRERMLYTDLIRLTGIKDTSEEGRAKIFKLYDNLLTFLQGCQGTDMNFIFDRMFFSEYVYAQLGKKDYDFNSEFNILCKKLNNLQYDMYFLLLVADMPSIEERLKRDKPEFINSSFSVANTVNQQSEYKKVANMLRLMCPALNVHILDTSNKDPYDVVYDIIEGSH
jgi:thymidylate kinase